MRQRRLGQTRTAGRRPLVADHGDGVDPVRVVRPRIAVQERDRRAGRTRREVHADVLPDQYALAGPERVRHRPHDLPVHAHLYRAGGPEEAARIDADRARRRRFAWCPSGRRSGAATGATGARQKVPRLGEGQITKAELRRPHWARLAQMGGQAVESNPAPRTPSRPACRTDPHVRATPTRHQRPVVRHPVRSQLKRLLSANLLGVNLSCR